MFRTVDGTEKNSNHCEKEEIITQSPYINIHFKGCLLSFVMKSCNVYIVQQQKCKTYVGSLQLDYVVCFMGVWFLLVWSCSMIVVHH